MKTDTKSQVLLAVYIEYQKDLPKMGNITNTALNMDIDVFHAALQKLENEGMIHGLSVFAADNDAFYHVDTANMKLTRDGIAYIEQTFGIRKELTAADKLNYVIKKCGVYGLQALKLFGVEALKAIAEIY